MVWVWEHLTVVEPYKMRLTDRSPGLNRATNDLSYHHLVGGVCWLVHHTFPSLDHFNWLLYILGLVFLKCWTSSVVIYDNKHKLHG
jgi:hypothetical protein